MEPFMNITIGIDVSKHKLDLFDSYYKKHRIYENSDEGINKIIQIYQKFDNRKVIIESTGTYQKSLHNLLDENNFQVFIVNPYKTRCFAKSAGFLTKTDKVDAKMLCNFGEKIDDMVPTPYPSKIQEELVNLTTYKDNLSKELQRNINYKEQNYLSTIVVETIEKHIKFLEENITKIQTKIDEIINSNDDLFNKKEIMESVPGVGKGTSTALLCYLPELGSINREKISALVGLVPWLCDSGQYRGKAMIKGGRANVRKAIYMPILSCIRCNSTLRNFYKILREKGKPAKVALVACMRKLIIILNVMVKNNTTWREKMFDI
jgi:transposase